MRPRPIPWNLIAVVLGTSLFLAMPYSLYVYTVAAVLGFMGALLFLMLSPIILAYQYVRYKRGPATFPFDKDREG